MGSTAIIAAIDKELARLYEVRSTLLKQEKKATKKAGPPAGKGKRKRRQVSAAGRARIAEAQRKRWAAAAKSEQITIEASAAIPLRPGSRNWQNRMSGRSTISASALPR